MERQAFESHFFNLLDLYKKIVSEVYLASEIRGKLALFKIYSSLRMAKGVNEGRVSIVDVYDLKYRTKYERALGDYFRTLYHAFSFVWKSDLSVEDQDRYAKVIRAQLSHAELSLLYINCLTPHGEGFRVLIERFSIFKHLDLELLPEKWKELKVEYKNCAFGERAE